MAERIIVKDTLEQYKDDMAQYALVINRKRATPNILDGLKPVQRRIIWDMYNDMKATSPANRKKSARISGSVIGKYHPHGDTAVYETMVPMANWYRCYIPLIYDKGNWGNIQGDSQAAARYTEASLNSFSVEVVINALRECREVVNWENTFDDTDKEPEYLPVAIPLLLINGTFGIGVGLTTRIPPHNIVEVIDATIALIKNPNARIVLYPDQCMPCQIIDADFKKISNTGVGKFIVRGIIDIEEVNVHIGHNKKNVKRTCLVIKSTPDLVTLNAIKDKLDSLIKDKVITQIVDIIEDHYSDKDGIEHMRMILPLAIGADPNYVRDMIYKNTSMQSTVAENFEVLDGLHPVIMGHKQYLLRFIDNALNTKFRLYCHRLKKYQTKYHEKEAYIKLMQSGEIDNIIDMIKKRTDTDDNKLMEYLIKKLNITDLQAMYIMKANLKTLSIGYLNKYIDEANELSNNINRCMDMITNRESMVKELLEELKYYKKKYGCPRRSVIVPKEVMNNIPQGDFTVILTEKNFVKKVSLGQSIGSFKNDKPRMILNGQNTENILIFDRIGKVYKLPIHKIPTTDRNSNGTDIRMINKKISTNIMQIMYEPELKAVYDQIKESYMVIVTAKGNIKKVTLQDFLTVPPSGIFFIKLDPDDYVSECIVASDINDVGVYSKQKALRMSIADIPFQKRNNKGMKSMADSDVIDGVFSINPSNTDIIIVTEHGKINRISTTALECSGRNRAGKRIIKLSQGDSIKCVKAGNENSIINMETALGNDMQLRIGDIEIGSTASTGKKYLPKSDIVVRCQLI